MPYLLGWLLGVPALTLVILSIFFTKIWPVKGGSKEGVVDLPPSFWLFLWVERRLSRCPIKPPR